MNNVNDYLIVSDQLQRFSVLLGNEQNLLDTMASQVKQAEVTRDNTDSNITLLDAMGIEILNTDPIEAGMIQAKLGDIKDRYVNAYKVCNKKTQQKFDTWVGRSQNKKCDLFFHGSRNENWMPILETGLVLRPTNAVISGKMFGYGTYFADKAKKSLGYTSASGSYWARGTSSEAFMALFNVHLGNSLHVKRRESWMGSLNESQLKAKGQYDSLFAEGGIDLINNEYIVYNEDQSTIKYLVQING